MSRFAIHTAVFGLALTAALSAGTASAQWGYGGWGSGYGGWGGYGRGDSWSGRGYGCHHGAYRFGPGLRDIDHDGDIDAADGIGSPAILPATGPVGGPAIGGPAVGGPAGSAAPAIVPGGSAAPGGPAGPATPVNPGVVPGPKTGGSGPGVAQQGGATSVGTFAGPSGLQQKGVAKLASNQKVVTPSVVAKTAVPVVPAAAPAVAAAPAAALVEAAALVGQWQASNKDIAGREMVMQLNVETDGSATLRIQTRGQEPFELKLPYSLDKNVFALGDGDQKLVLGEIASAEADKLIIKKDGSTLTFSKI